MSDWVCDVGFEQDTGVRHSPEHNLWSSTESTIPKEDRTYTVGCAFERLIPDEGHKQTIRDAVLRTHKATVLATELLNLHIRRCIEELDGKGLQDILTSNWLLNAYNEVTCGKGTPKVDKALHETNIRCMPHFTPVDRKGLTQILSYECINLKAVATNNIWMHFQRRLLSHVRNAHVLDEVGYATLSKDQRRHRKLHLMQVAEDMGRPPSGTRRSPVEFHAWVTEERIRLGIDTAVGNWANKPLLYHLKTHPECFLLSMHIMSADRETKNRKAFALFPLRRTLVPRHVRFDQKVLRSLLSLGGSESQKQASRAKRRKTEGGYVEDAAVVLKTRAPKRSKVDLVDEKSQAFNEVLDLRAAGVRQRQCFDFAFTTDGVCVRLQYTKPKSNEEAATLAFMPNRGIHAIDELKRVSRLEQLHVVGIDPGVREIIVAVDQDDPKGTVPVRYTQAQRLRDLRSRQYTDEANRSKPFPVVAAEEDLSGFNSRSASLQQFHAYCVQRHCHLDECMDFYTDLTHRRRRWKTYIKSQQSEERLYRRLESIHKKGDVRTLVLAYGSWGATDGASCIKKGNPPTIGVGLMRKLSKRFVVSLTPEHFTSKTCCRCLGVCGPWEDIKTSNGKEVRGLRICQDEGCKLPQNRDRTGASNIGLQFKRLFEDKGPIRTMTEEEREFHRLNTSCGTCVS